MLGCCLTATNAARADVLPQSARAFLVEHCYDCHSDEDADGELDLESLIYAPNDRNDLKRWSLIFDRVKKGEMPPRGTPEGKDAFVELMGDTLHTSSIAHQKQRGRVRSRRLNRREFENTLHDLLGIDLPIIDLLPEDATQDGFDNVAEAQPLSYHLLEKYMDIVDLALEEAFTRATMPKPSYNEIFPASELSDNFNKPGRRNRQPLFKDGYAVAMACDNNYHGRMYATTVPETGWYRFTIKAKAFNPQNGRGVWTQLQSGICSAKAPRFFWIGEFLAESEMKEFTFEAWVKEGHRLELRPGDRTLKFSSVKSVTSGKAVENGGTGTAVESIKVERIYKGLAKDEIRKHLFGDLDFKKGQLLSNHPEKDLSSLIQDFALKAFRRPVSNEILAAYLDHAQATLRKSGSLLEALSVGYRSILSSPRFLFFKDSQEELDGYSIASRLSYFLWSSMPDDELMLLAKSDKLKTPEVLSEQVNRMLNDPRSEHFIKSFTDNWLELKHIDFTTPDRKLYPEFDNILKHSMLKETRAFLRAMIDSDLSVTNVMDSDFAIVNDRLARHYGIEGSFSSEMKKVSLKGNEHRGGIITHGSILKVTANGTTTSPVVRGVWLLERILGAHIPPPPDDVPAVEPDIRGASNIRDQLDKHRSSKSCRACHKKIDPPGFALENFDVIGGWRDNYRALLKQKKWWSNGQPVDASHVMEDGQAFSDIEGFKSIALSNPESIAKNLIEKLLIYGTGASIEFADRKEIERILQKSKKNNYGLRTLIHHSVQSSIFLSK